MRFSIRDLLWLTVVVAMGVWWWVARGQMLEWFNRVQIADEAAFREWEAERDRLPDPSAPAPNPPKN